MIQRVPVERFWGREPEPLLTRPLRIVQLSDTHLGPWKSVSRLRDQVAKLVARDPDLVMLTGDFLTMESMGSPGCLEDALRPLRPLADRCAAIFGNHDHEAPDHVRDAMGALGIPLLIDEECCFETPIGPVQIVGSDYVSRGRALHRPIPRSVSLVRDRWDCRRPPSNNIGHGVRFCSHLTPAS